MTRPTKSGEPLLTVVALMKAKPGREEAVRSALEALIEPTQQDLGMVTYKLHRGTEDASLFCFYEVWTSPETLDAHLRTPHLQVLNGQVGDLVDGEITIHRLQQIG